MSENEGQEISRRSFLVKARNLLAAAAFTPRKLPDLIGEKSTSLEKEMQSQDWGKISNAGHDHDMTRGIFFFAGVRNQNSPYAHLQPETEWKDENVGKIFDEIRDANVNVIKLSWWGSDKETEQWAPTINTTSVNQRVFDEAKSRGILVAPVVEVSPGFEFWKDFPDNTDKLEERIQTLLSTYGQNLNWVQMYNRKGEKRHLIQLIETIHGEPVDSQKFANTFDIVAENIFKKTGIKIGFGIDPTPLPSYGSYEGATPHALSQRESILAITPYNIFSDGENENERLENADVLIAKWVNSGLPVIFPAMTGFNDEGTDRVHTQKFGNSEDWRKKQEELIKKYQQKLLGVSLDTWNTFTEGGAVVPTVEYRDVNMGYAKNIFSNPNFNPELEKELKYKAVAPSITTE